MKNDALMLARQKRNLTQEAVASKVGISRAYYTAIENRNRMPSLPVAQKISNLLDLNTDIFLLTR